MKMGTKTVDENSQLSLRKKMESDNWPHSEKVKSADQLRVLQAWRHWSLQAEGDKESLGKHSVHCIWPSFMHEMTATHRISAARNKMFHSVQQMKQSWSPQAQGKEEERDLDRKKKKGILWKVSLGTADTKQPPHYFRGYHPGKLQPLPRQLGMRWKTLP